MDFPKGSAWKDEDELNRYLVNNYPNENHNLLRLGIYLEAQGTSLGEMLDGMKVEGSPYLKLSSRD